MKLKVLLTLIIAGLAGYVLGTENGRRQRDELIRMIRREAPIDEALDAVSGVADSVADGAASAADEVRSTADDIAGSAQS